MICRNCGGRASAAEKGFVCEDCGATVPYGSKTHHVTRKASGETDPAVRSRD